MANTCEAIITKVLDQGTYIKDCQKIHENFYTYPFTQYVGSKFNVIVTCPVHGNFSIRAKNHKQGRGCNQCGSKKQGMSARKSYQDILEEANQVHEFFYSYEDHSFEELSGLPIKNLRITCPLHGGFSQTANNHVRGAGCRHCYLSSKSDTQEEFLRKALKVHSNYYTYSKSVYKGFKSKVCITCPIHKEFWQTPASHLSGAGCPSCCVTGYKTNVPGRLYILSSEDIVKIGITNKTVLKRLEKINKGPHKFTVVADFYFEDGAIPRLLESKYLKYLRQYYEQPTNKFDGYTECFIGVRPKDIIELISEELR